MQNRNKQRFSVKAYIIKSLILISVFTIVFLYSKYDNSNFDYQLENVAYLYDGNEIVGVNEGQNAEILAQSHETVGTQAINDNISDDGEKETLNTKVIKSPSILKYSISNEDQLTNIDYVKENTRVLKQGYTITIDGQYKYYVPDYDMIKSTVNQIMLAYVPDQSYVDYYQTTGTFKEYTEDGKTFTGLSFDNQITVSEGYQQGSVYIDNQEDLIFDLFHKDQNRIFDYISDDKSIPSIVEEQELSDTEFKLNNPSITLDNVTYNTQPIVINKIDPILNVVQTFETTETETVEFATVQEEDESLLTGQFELETQGVDGKKEITYENKMVNGQVVEETQIAENVISKPVHQVIRVGEGTQVNSVTVSDEGTILSSNVSTTSSGMIWPSSSKTVTCEYGGYAGHTGIDIQDYYGAPEYAADDGVVVTSGWSNYGYGYHVVLDHGNGIRTLYAHQNQQPPVSVGQVVKKGQVVGFEGATGNVTGEHLHFEVQINGTAVNPRPYITSEPAYNMGTVCS